MIWTIFIKNKFNLIKFMYMVELKITINLLTQSIINLTKFNLMFKIYREKNQYIKED